MRIRVNPTRLHQSTAADAVTALPHDENAECVGACHVHVAPSSMCDSNCFTSLDHRRLIAALLHIEPEIICLSLCDVFCCGDKCLCVVLSQSSSRYC
jgi:hypothetical protein